MNERQKQAVEQGVPYYGETTMTEAREINEALKSQGLERPSRFSRLRDFGLTVDEANEAVGDD